MSTVLKGISEETAKVQSIIKALRMTTSEKQKNELLDQLELFLNLTEKNDQQEELKTQSDVLKSNVSPSTVNPLVFSSFSSSFSSSSSSSCSSSSSKEEKISNDLTQSSSISSKDNFTSLHWACQNGNVDAVELLLSYMKMEEILKKSEGTGSTVLHLAIDSNPADYKRSIEDYNKIVKLLLEKDSSINGQSLLVGMTDEHGQTPLHLAIKLHKINKIELLLNYMSMKDLIIQTKEDRFTILHYTITWGIYWCASPDTEIAKLLLKREKALNGYSTLVGLGDSYGRTPLFFAISKDENSEEFVRFLLQNMKTEDIKKQAIGKYDLVGESRGLHKWTALHFAANNGSSNMVDLLMDIPGLAEIKDEDGNTAEDLVQENYDKSNKEKTNNQWIINKLQGKNEENEENEKHEDNDENSESEIENSSAKPRV